MSSGKHKSKTSLDKLDAKTIKILIVAAAAVVLAVAIIVAVLLITGGEEETPSPTPGVTLNPGVTPKPSGSDKEDPTESSHEEDPTDSSHEEDPTDATDAPEPVYYNPLTGIETEEDITARRPFAVMLNNLSVATPQSGVAAADILFEVPVEGGITRLMGIYQDFKGSLTLGSIRSARPYFVDLAMSFDAVYIHAGGSEDAYAKLKESGISYIDGVNGVGTGNVFFRDENRMHTMGYEHSLMLDVTALDGYMQKYGISSEHAGGFSAGLTFTDTEDDQRLGLECTRVDAVFNASKRTSFTYDSDTKLYYASQYGGPMTDSLTGRQVTARNVILITARITPISGDSAGRLNATLSGNGSGWFIANGEAERITWTRTSSTSQFVFTDSDGKEIALFPGSTYIGLLPISSGSVNFN